VPCSASDWPSDWNRDTQRNLEEAAHALGTAKGLSVLIENPYLLTLASLDKEAIASSTIENTIATPDEFVLYQAIGGPERSAAVEVGNYRQALLHGVGRLGDLPISTRLILELHERLLNRTQNAHMAGKLKTGQNYIAPNPTIPIEKATFVPPPPEMIESLLDALWRFVHDDHTVGKVAKIAITHYQFETIHPFGDGNGRVGRLLVVLQMFDLGLLAEPVVYPSYYFERYKDEYLDRLQAVRDRGDLDQWVGFFARALTASALETNRLALRIRETVAALRESRAGVRRRASKEAVISAFSRRLYLTVKDLAAEAGISRPLAAECLHELEAEGTVREISGQKWRKVYVCQPLFEAIFHEAPLEP